MRQSPQSTPVRPASFWHGSSVIRFHTDAEFLFLHRPLSQTPTTKSSPPRTSHSSSCKRKLSFKKTWRSYTHRCFKSSGWCPLKFPAQNVPRIKAYLPSRHFTTPSIWAAQRQTSLDPSPLLRSWSPQVSLSARHARDCFAYSAWAKARHDG